MNDDTIVISTPEGIAMVRLLAVRRALKLEVETGMKVSRGSLLNVARSDYGVFSRTKKGALKELNALIDSIQQG